MLVKLGSRVLAAAVGLAVAGLVTSTGHGARSRALKSIRTAVPYAPGGVADIVAPLVAEEIGRTCGVTLVVENRPGAAGAVGTETVARPAADGNTLLVVSTPFYDPLTSFEPLCYLVNAPTVIVVNSTSPYRTLAQLLDDARIKPGQITMASIGPASSFQLGFEMLKRAARVDMTFVPYPGNAPALDTVPGPAGYVYVRHLCECRSAFEGGNAAGARRRKWLARRAATGRPNACRGRLPAHRRRCLVRRLRASAYAGASYFCTRWFIEYRT